jgi:hypothetical protein
MISNPASCCFKYRSRRTDQWHCNSRTASGNGPWLCCAVVGSDGGCRLLSGCTTLLASGCALSPNTTRMLRHQHHGGSRREIVPENPVLAHTFILILWVKAQSNLNTFWQTISVVMEILKVESFKPLRQTRLNDLRRYPWTMRNTSHFELIEGRSTTRNLSFLMLNSWRAAKASM